MCLQFPSLYRVVIIKNLFISAIFGNASSFPWDLNFHRNLNDLEIEDLERLILFLPCVDLSPFVLDVRVWSLSSSNSFSTKSFYLDLSNTFDPIPFYLVEFFWKSKVPTKVKVFAWLVAHKAVNSNGMLQLKRGK